MTWFALSQGLRNCWIGLREDGVLCEARLLNCVRHVGIDGDHDTGVHYAALNSASI